MSLAPSASSSYYPSPMALAHTVNSSGRMGLFVDSSSCSCSGCSTYRLQTLDIPLWDAADAHLFTAPAPAPSPSLPLPPFVPGALARTVTGLGYQAPTEEDDGASSSSVLGPSPTPAAESVSIRAALDSGRAPSLRGMGLGLSMGRALPSSRRELDHVDELMDRLRGLRSELQLQQDRVYSGVDARSHDEMAAQDAQFDEMDRQIHAIEQVMLSFGAIFRTR
jgi:hypothetical protein